MYARFRRSIMVAQCSPAGLVLALAVIVASYLSIRYHAGVLAALRATAALALASAGLGLLAWVTVGLSRKTAQEPAGKPDVFVEPKPDVFVEPKPDVFVEPKPDVMTLITRDGRTLVFSDPGSLVRPGSSS